MGFTILNNFKPLNSLLIKPSGPDCNLDCTYCFYLEKASLFPELKMHRMSDQVLESLVRQMGEQGTPNISFAWQGGEPTLMGLHFYKQAVKYQQTYGNGKTIGNGFQTNGLLLDGNWAKFFKEHNFLVGLSIDGPQDVHDHYRVHSNKRGSWERVMQSMETLLKNDVDVNALTVVSDYSVDHAEEIYNFHKKNGLVYMQFIPCVEIDENDPAKAARFSVSAERYGAFLIKMFDLWQADFKNGLPTTFIRYFDAVFHNYVSLPAPECTLNETCGSYLVVEHNGDVFSCDFFVEPRWRLGNVQQDRLLDMLNSPTQTQFGLLKANLHSECRKCEWLQYCHGGCTKDRLHDPRDNNLNHFCKGFKMFFSHAHSRLSEMAAEWQRNNPQYTSVRPKQNSRQRVQPNDPCVCGSGKKYKKCCGRSFEQILA